MMDASKTGIVIFIVAAFHVSTIYSACQPPTPCNKPACPKPKPCTRVTTPCQQGMRVGMGGCGGGMIMPGMGLGMGGMMPRMPMGGIMGGMGGMMNPMMGGMMNPMLIAGRPMNNIGLPRGNAMCRDMNTACSAWAKKGYCSQKVYYRFMTQNCCASCKTAMAKDKTGPDGGTAPKIVATGTATATATGTGTAPATATGTGAATKPVVAAEKPFDLAAVNAAAVAKATADAAKKAALEAQTADIKKLLAAAEAAAKRATDAAEKIAAAQALAQLGNQGAQAKPDANTNDVKNAGNTAGPDKTPIDPKVYQQLVDAFVKQQGGGSKK